MLLFHWSTPTAVDERSVIVPKQLDADEPQSAHEVDDVNVRNAQDKQQQQQKPHNTHTHTHAANKQTHKLDTTPLHLVPLATSIRAHRVHKSSRSKVLALPCADSRKMLPSPCTQERLNRREPGPRIRSRTRFGALGWAHFSLTQFRCCCCCWGCGFRLVCLTCHSLQRRNTTRHKQKYRMQNRTPACVRRVDASHARGCANKQRESRARYYKSRDGGDDIAVVRLVLGAFVFKEPLH